MINVFVNNLRNQSKYVTKNKMRLSFKENRDMILKSYSKTEYQSKKMIYMLKALEKWQQLTIKQHFDKLLYQVLM